MTGPTGYLEAVTLRSRGAAREDRGQVHLEKQLSRAQTQRPAPLRPISPPPAPTVPQASLGTGLGQALYPQGPSALLLLPMPARSGQLALTILTSPPPSLSALIARQLPPCCLPESSTQPPAPHPHRSCLGFPFLGVESQPSGPSPLRKHQTWAADSPLPAPGEWGLGPSTHWPGCCPTRRPGG